MGKTMDRRDFLKLSAVLGAGAMTPNITDILQAHLAQNKPLKCAMSSAGLAGSWNAQGKDAAEKAAKMLNVELNWFDGEFDPVKQRAKLDQVATQKWDFVSLQPGSIGTLVEPITALIKAGIPVIDMDTLIAPLDKMKEMGVVTLIAPDNVSMAEAVVSRVVEKMGGKGKIAHTGGAAGHTGAQGRYQGFLNIMAKYPDVKVVDDQPGDWDTAKAASIWETILNKNPDITGCFCDNDDMALAAQKVIAGAGKEKQVFVGGVDAMQPAIQAVMDGKMVATARNSAVRIHTWGIITGVVAATLGLDKARQVIPDFILVDGPAIYADIDSNDKLKDTPWKLKAYGKSTAPGQIWAEDQLLF